MDKKLVETLEALTDVFIIIYSRVIKEVKDPFIAVSASDALVRIIMDVQEAPHTPSVDDVVAGLKKAMADEHGQGGKK